MKISDMRKSLDIFEKYLGSDDKYWDGGAEHDIVYSYLTIYRIPEDSEDGKLLLLYGWHVEDDCWAMHV